MLRKLMKHEFLASYRIHLSIYASILVMAVISSLSFEYDVIIFGGLIFGLMMLMIGALGVFTLYNIVVSMYQRVYGRQGYLLFSIPASTVQIITAKVLVNVIWLTLTSIVSIASVSMFVLIAVPLEPLEVIFDEFSSLIQFTPFDIITFFVYALLMVIYQIGFFQFLFALLNHVYKGEKKTLMGILLYFGVNYAVTFVITIFTGSFYMHDIMNPQPFVIGDLWISIGVYFVVTCGLYFGSYVFIDKKLELQ
jgi:hypothetical protein